MAQLLPRTLQHTYPGTVPGARRRYTLRASVGTPRHAVSLLLDTGSCELAVFATAPRASVSLCPPAPPGHGPACPHLYYTKPQLASTRAGVNQLDCTTHRTQRLRCGAAQCTVQCPCRTARSIYGYGIEAMAAGRGRPSPRDDSASMDRGGGARVFL